MNSPEELKISELPHEPFLEELPDHPILIPGEWPAHVLDYETIRVWACLDEDLELEILSDIPDGHALDFEIDAVGADYLIEKGWCLNDPIKPALTRALSMGVAPLQPFYIEFYLHYYKTSTQDGDDYDCEMDWEILHVSPITPTEIANRFEQYLNR